MRLTEIDAYFRSFLAIEEMARSDNSLNGIQVGKDESPIGRIAFAVDACLDSFKQAAEWQADMLLVHHGLFWGKPAAVTGILYDRINFLVRHDMALYAAHLPLDMHPEVGNNAGMVRALGLEEVTPFGNYRGTDIGFKGIFQKPHTIDSVLDLLSLKKEDCLGILPFGTKEITSVGVVSGGAATEAYEALEENLDLFITGEISHQIYHYCLEGGLNLISGGHYATEVWGVRQVAEKTARELAIETRFFDIPTGL